MGNSLSSVRGTLYNLRNIKRLPTNCACGKKFNIDHALTCMKGGFIHRRHDEIRNIFAEMLQH